MARLRLGAVSLAALMLVAATTTLAGAALNEPHFSDTIALDLPEDPFRLVGSDLNGDGNDDLASVNWNSSSVSVLLSRGDGNFVKRVDYRAPRHPAGVAVGDINGDGRPDLVTAGHDRAGSIAVWLNSGGGSFVRAGTYAAGGYAWSVAVADVNGDGVLDLLTAHHGRQQLAVLIGIGDGRFHGAQRYAGAGARELAVGDLNRDGKLDVMLGTRGKRHVAVRLGAGDGSFSAPRNYKVGLKNPGLAVADFNHDRCSISPRAARA
jgi:FG-GAP-like repeat